MRKNIYLISILFLVIIMVAACGSKDKDVKMNASEEVENDPSAEESKEESKKDEAEKNEKEKTEEKEKEKEDLAEEETSESLYTIDDIWRITPIDDANSEVALITIDDAPDNHALEMAHTLKDLDVSAIFFVNGHFLETEEEKEIIKEIYELGFTIGNHTYSHADLQSLSEEEQHDEIIKVSDMVEEIIGERPKFFRAPFGQNTDYSKSVAKDEGMVLMNWTYGYDWNADYQTKEAITDIMLNAPELNDGANLLMHDRDWTNAALADIVTGLRDQGYELIDPKYIETIE